MAEAFVMPSLAGRIPDSATALGAGHDFGHFAIIRSIFASNFVVYLTFRWMILHIASARRSASLGAITGDDVITPPDTDPQPAIRILVAEHQPIVRHGLVTMLSLERDMSVSPKRRMRWGHYT